MSSQLLISNYGLFWKTEDVFWGAGRSAGALFGVRPSKRTRPPVDFRDQRGIYVLYADYNPIYVGQNHGQSLIRRLIQHRDDDLADRWNRFSWFGTRRVNMNRSLSKLTDAAHSKTRSVLNHIEAILIHTFEPALNRQGGKFGNSSHQYVQVRDERLGLSEAVILKDLHDKVNL